MHCLESVSQNFFREQNRRRLESIGNLQSHAHTKDGNLASKVSNCVSADTGVGAGMARSRANYELGWFLVHQLFNGDLVISENMNCSTLKDQILVDIPSEGVVVVDKNEIRRSGHWR
jgi:hypothetical protein